MCSSFYYLRGGLEKYMFELIELLERHGHEVIPFCMDHAENFPTPYSKYFVSHIDYPAILRKPKLGLMLKAVERLFFSSEARRQIKRIIEDTKPDIVHVHGIGHEISPFVLKVVKSFNIPVIQTLHDYGLLCPNTSFVSHGEVCERCKGGRYYNVVLRRCKRDSLPASLLACASQYAYMMTNIYKQNVDVYISPSSFLKRKLLEHGIKKRIVEVPNFINLDSCQPGVENAGYCIYAGRLLSIKGIRTLMDAAKLVRHIKILVAGDGELADEIRAIIAEEKLDNVKLLGYVASDELMRLMSSSNFMTFPSEWYENYPMSIIESFACGKPVIASNIGALPELVINGQNGLLFEPGHPEQLAARMQELFDHPEKAVEMGKRGRETVVINNDPESHYRQIMKVYQDLLGVSATINQHSGVTT